MTKATGNHLMNSTSLENTLVSSTLAIEYATQRWTTEVAEGKGEKLERLLNEWKI